MNIIPSNIVELLNRYSNSKQDGYYLNDFLSRVSESEPIIPVLGMQGVGKSTLLNALLKEKILPVEADETTCVPVEIKYGENEHADVLFKDDNKTIVINTIDELQEYVDNNYNPGNEKNVSKIVLYRNRELLKNGIVVVDLPGVGSLTEANQETTTKYIQNLCTAIFVFLDAMKKSDILFIKSVWSQFPKAIFVQNNWDLSEQQIAESVEHNTKCLNNIAYQLNNRLDNEILVINADDALKGVLKKDSELVESSNINSLVSVINSFASNWTKMLNETSKEKVILTVDSAVKIATKLIEELSHSHEEIIRHRQHELQEMQTSTNRLEEELSKVKSYLGQKEVEVRSSSRTKASECIKKLRAAMNKTIDSGVFDGDALTDTFKDEQEEKTTECLNMLFDEMTQIKIEVDGQLQNLCETVLENDMAAASEAFEKDRKTKYEKGVDLLIKIGGGIGGWHAGVATVGGIAAAVKAGALSGSVFTPGIGTAIGAAVGLVVGIIGSIFGSYAKRKIQEKRASETKRELEPYYEKIETAIKKTISEKFNAYSNSVKTAMDNIISERRRQEMTMKENLTKFEDIQDKDKFENDIKLLNEYKTSL